jgi:succinyl-diaminopimelate desuccinylase
VPPVTALGERLAARTLELVDIPSESRDEARLAAHVAGVLRGGGVPVRDLGDTCVLAGPDDAPVLLAGHLDTVPAQDNRPGSIAGGRVHGLGASDMKGALAVMLELALAGAPYRCLLFGRGRSTSR